MAGNVVVCSLGPGLEELLSKFRFNRNSTNNAIVLKVDRESQTIVVDEVLEDLEDVDELREALPDHQPRFVVYSFKLVHDDGRSSFPMCFIFSSPRDCKPEMNMMYAGSKLSLVEKVGLQNVFEIRELEELTEEWIVNKLLKK